MIRSYIQADRARIDRSHLSETGGIKIFTKKLFSRVAQPCGAVTPES